MRHKKEKCWGWSRCGGGEVRDGVRGRNGGAEMDVWVVRMGKGRREGRILGEGSYLVRTMAISGLIPPPNPLAPSPPPALNPYPHLASESHYSPYLEDWANQ